MRPVCVLAVIGLLAGCGGSHEALRLHRAPYLGLACDRTTVHRCDRLGLAVWLVHPASGISAVVDGVRVRLRTHSGGSGPYGSHLYWQGFFRDPHAQQLANNSKSIPVRVRVTAPDGSTSAETRTVHVSKGYG